ncbi:MAG TPA: GntR family transcriptional regulator [Candidatus Binataceae bacterium]|nr:GntR family transcriptional regulator [Candidatus Binataceae bacterium]
MAPNKRSLRIDLSSTIPVYQQIADQVRAMLVAGQLSPGDRLPTVRQVAVDLGVNHNTVAEAYRNLADEGWLLLERGRGAVVTARSTPAATNKARVAFAQRLRGLIAQVRAAGVSPQVIRSEFEDVAESLLTPKRKEGER